MQVDWLNRREFILIGGAAVPWPLAAHAQQPAKVFSIGWLTAQRASSLTPFLGVFRSGLAELGYREATTWKSNIAMGTTTFCASRRLQLNSRAKESNFWLYRALLFLSYTNSSCPYPPSTSLAEIPLSPGLLKVSLARGET